MPTDNVQLIARFLRYLQVERRSAHNTIVSYDMDLQNFAQWFGRPFAEIQRTDVQRYLSELLALGRSGKTVSRHLASLRQLHRFLLDEGLVERDPTRHMPVPKTWKKVPPSLSLAEVEKMVASLVPSSRNLRDKAMLLTFFSSGLRVGELTKLKIRDLDLEAGAAKVWDGKGGKDGIVPLSPPAIAALKAHFELRAKRLTAESPYVFPGRAGRQITRLQVYNRIRSIGQTALGRRISPHSLRRAFATTLIEGGADIRLSTVEALAAYLGLELKPAGKRKG